MTASVNYVHVPCASERIITSCCGERCFRHEAAENERLGLCGYCAARNPTATDHCDRCGERFYFRLVARTRDRKWLCRGCQEETLRDRFSELESELIALGSRAFTVAPEHVRRELEQGCYAGARLLERLRGVLAQARRGWVRDVLVALPEEYPGVEPKEGAAMRRQGVMAHATSLVAEASASTANTGKRACGGDGAEEPFVVAVVPNNAAGSVAAKEPAFGGANFSKPESRARRLLRHGFEPYGRHGWWSRGAGPSMRPSQATQVIDHEFQARSAAWFGRCEQ